MPNWRETSFQVDRDAQLSPTGEFYPADLPTENGTMRRRFSDLLEHTLQLALRQGDLTAGEQLFGIMKGLDERYRIRGGQERRNESAVPRLARQIELRKQSRVYRGFRQTHAEPR